MNINDMITLCVLGMGVVMVTLTILMFFVIGISKAVGESKSESEKPSPAPLAVNPSVSSVPAAPVFYQTDTVELIGTDEKTAAMIMAIVSDQTGIPLERLRFKSIRFLLTDEAVDDKTAATIMAIVSDFSKIPLSRLDFKSIRLLNN